MYTAAHMIMKFILSRIWACSAAIEIESVSWSYVLLIAVPIGVATALDVMLSNFSLMYITLTLYTIIKSSVLIWTFFWGVVLRIEPFKINTFCAVLFIVGGISLAVASSTDVSVIGIVMVLGAAASGGIRWALVQKLMTVNEQSKNVFVSIYRFAPASALSMIPFAVGMELVPFLKSDFFLQSSDNILAATAALVVSGGLIAFSLITTEVHLVNLTSSLTMGVMGQVKEVIQIVLSMIIFHDHVNLLNAVGIVVAMVAVGYYKRIKMADNEEVKYRTLSQVSTLLMEHERIIRNCDVVFFSSKRHIYYNSHDKT
jgi:solute carrier family 35, member C2